MRGWCPRPLDDGDRVGDLDPRAKSQHTQPHTGGKEERPVEVFKPQRNPVQVTSRFFDFWAEVITFLGQTALLGFGFESPGHLLGDADLIGRLFPTPNSGQSPRKQEGQENQSDTKNKRRLIKEVKKLSDQTEAVNLGGGSADRPNNGAGNDT